MMSSHKENLKHVEVVLYQLAAGKVARRLVVEIETTMKYLLLEAGGNNIHVM